MSIVSQFNSGVDWLLTNDEKIKDTTQEGMQLLKQLNIISDADLNKAQSDSNQVVDRVVSHFAPDYVKGKIQQYWKHILIIGGVGGYLIYKGTK